jgi:tetratricopeptide (TPR) repeat protein
VVIEQAEMALELYRAIGDDRGAAESLLMLTSGYAIDARYEQAFAAAQDALRHAERAADPVLVGLAFGALARGSTRIDDALPYIRAAVEQLRTAGAMEQIALLLSTTGFAALGEGAFEQADDLLAGALDVVHDLHNPFIVALIQGNRALAALFKGRLAEAAEAFGEEMAVARAHAMPTFYFEGLLGFGALAAVGGDDRCAATLAAAAVLYDDRGVWESEKSVYDHLDVRFLAPARERLGEAAWKRAGDDARSMTTDAVLALADEVRLAYEMSPAPVVVTTGAGMSTG